MTLVINIGRRVPRKWVKRMAQKAKGFVSFQENLWLIINQSLNLAKKQANQAGTLSFVMVKEDEIENLQIATGSDEWVSIVEINGAQVSLLDELYTYINELKGEL